MRFPRLRWAVARAGWGWGVILWGCSVDPGEHFQVADVTYDEDWFYCQVEPFLNAQACGAGDASQGDRSGGCHHNVTGYRLSAYSPPVSDSCVNGKVTVAPPAEAQANFQSSQIKMSDDPDRAPLLTRPSGRTAHPRKIFDLDDPEADVLREWATRAAGR